MIYLAAIVFTVVRITTIISDRRIKAEREFKEISNVVSVGDKGFMDEVSKNLVQDALTRSETLQGLIVSGSDNTYPFEREQGIVIPVHNGNGFQFAGWLGFSKEPLFGKLSDSSTISAIYSIFDYQLLISIFKQSLIAILAAFCIAFIGLLVQFFSGKSSSLEPVGKDGFLADDDLDLPELDFDDQSDDLDFDLPELDSDDQSDDLDFSLPELDSDDEQSDDLDFILPEEDFDSQSDDLDFSLPEEDFDTQPDNLDFDLPELDSGDDQSDDLDFSLPELDSDDDQSDDLDFTLPDEDPDTQPDEQEDTANTKEKEQSSHQVLAAQSDTAPHLISVLQQCTAQDNDLACVMIESKEVGGSEDLYQSIADEALKFFELTDGIFQKDKRGMSIILPGETLEGCRDKVETFHKQVLDKHGSVFWEPSDVCIGISARQGRDIDANRLLLEASTALKKALSDIENPIIAFKVDPARYKAFLDQKK
ncbi:MAG: hypothetical protein LBB43_02405 [Spirochaetaceae bacterium]|nr:hypothetical protein [Spirochaetaceae bacterium]